MLLLYALTKDWYIFTRQMKGAVMSGPTRYLFQNINIFGLQSIKVETQSFCRLDVGELVLHTVFGEGFNKLRINEILQQSKNPQW